MNEQKNNEQLDKKDSDHTNQPLTLHSAQAHELHDSDLHGPARSQ